MAAQRPWLIVIRRGWVGSIASLALTRGTSLFELKDSISGSNDSTKWDLILISNPEPGQQPRADLEDICPPIIYFARDHDPQLAPIGMFEHRSKGARRTPVVPRLYPTEARFSQGEWIAVSGRRLFHRSGYRWCVNRGVQILTGRFRQRCGPRLRGYLTKRARFALKGRGRNCRL